MTQSIYTNADTLGVILLNKIQPDLTELYAADVTHLADTTAHGATGEVVGTTNTQTLTNKTLTTPVINSPTGIAKGDIGLGNVDNTSDATKNAATVTLTNKTLTTPVINSPTGITKGDVGLGNADNTSDATKNAATVTLTNKTLDAPTVTNPVVDFESTGVDDNATSTAMTIDSSERVGIGTASPAALLHVYNGASGGTANGNSEVVIEAETGQNIGLQFLTSNNRSSYIYFGDEDNNDVGMIRYNHDDNYLDFTVNAASAIHINSSRNVGIGTTSVGEKLVVNGNVEADGFNYDGTNVVTNTEIGYLDGVTSAIQTQINAAVGTMVLLATKTASDDASIEFKADIDSTYKEYEIHLLNVIPATDSVTMNAVTSTNAGVSYDTGASDYRWAVEEGNSATADPGDAYMQLTTQAIGSDTNEAGISGTFKLFNPSITAYINMKFDGMYITAGSTISNVSMGGSRLAAANVDAVKFYFSSGNIESGIFKLYGIK